MLSSITPNQFRMPYQDFENWFQIILFTNIKKTDNQELLFNFLFDKFTKHPEKFFKFLNYYKKELLNANNIDQQKDLANKFLLVLSRLCNRFNFYKEKNIMNDLCFQIINPDEFNRISKILYEYKHKSNNITEQILEKLEAIIRESKFPCQIKGRYKNIYSIHKKVSQSERKNKVLQLNDIFAFRIIAENDSIGTCFAILHLLHDKFYPIPKSYKDYISIPKINGYQSIHTGLINVVPELKIPIEIQIRTRTMHEFAENGLAAHWIYDNIKESKIATSKERQLLNYLTHISDVNNHKEKTLCFSFNGDILELDKGSTIIDFAYRIHSDIGNKCQGAIVNNIPQPITYQIQAGDKIKIQTADTKQLTPEWLNHIQTNHARKHIQANLR